MDYRMMSRIDASMEEGREWLTREELTKLLRVSDMTVNRWEKGGLTCVRKQKKFYRLEVVKKYLLRRYFPD